MKNLKKLTLLHSNDLHGDFLAKEVDKSSLGGVSMLSGYIYKVRSEEENVVYTISGDMLQGSVIDSEYKGLSTIEIMNMLSPDVATLGNHEVDYGIGHLLFIEKCARFPIINANLYLTTNHVRLFKSHIILEVGGMRILFIGILTEDVLAQARKERLVGSFVDVEEAAQEVGKICNSYQTEDIDFTVLLTHIGFEEDKRLAELLDPRWGVDLIVGGHSHTMLKEPCVVAGIPIVQAASGTEQVGRFDIMVDTDRNAIDSYTWELIPIDEEHCPRDIPLENIITKYKSVTDQKYNRYITRLAKEYTHPRRDRETELGRMFADAMMESLGLDIMLMASGSLRREEMGPIVEYQDLVQMYPYGDEVYRVTLTGKQVKHMITHIFRPEVFDGVHTEFYQYSKGLRVVCDQRERRVREISFKGEEIDDNALFRVGLQNSHYENMEQFLGITKEEAEMTEPSKVIATNSLDVLDEYFSNKEMVVAPEDRRWITVE